MINISTQECNKLTSENFTARLKQANLESKSDVANFVKKKKKIDLNKNELNGLSKKAKAISAKRLTKDLLNKFSILNGAKYFSSRIFQNYLVFIPTKKYIKYFSETTRIDSCKSNGILEEYIENITKSDSNFAPTFVGHHLLRDVNFDGHCLINNISIPKKVINLYISYTRNPQLRKFKYRFYIRKLLIWICKVN